MAKQTMRGGGGNRKHGRGARKPKTAKYKLGNVREKNKIKRILQSNGDDAATKYASKYGLTRYLMKLMVR